MLGLGGKREARLEDVHKRYLMQLSDKSSGAEPDLVSPKPMCVLQCMQIKAFSPPVMTSSLVDSSLLNMSG
jgi:hypothetical protein